MPTETKKKLVSTCLAKIQSLNFVEVRFTPLGDADRGVDGILRIYSNAIDSNFSTLIKPNLTIATANAISSSYNHHAHNLNIIIMAENISPSVAPILEANNLNYVDSLGNMFIKTDNIYIHITSDQKKIMRKRPSNLLTASAIKLISYFLMNPSRVNKKYREISKETGIALGSVGWIIRDLRERGYMNLVGKGVRSLTHRQELFETWITGYHEKLRPKLLLGNYRPLKHKNVAAVHNYISTNKNGVLIGGEFAASTLLEWLHPATITLHIFNNTTPTIRELGLVPDAKGPVTLIEGFGDISVYRINPNINNTISPLMIYAEISDSSSERIQDAAKEIFNKYLRDQIDE